MTMVLALGNRDQFVQVSDRRTSLDGQPLDDEYNKALVLHCMDACLLVGFAGLASAGTFRTNAWLRDTLLDCAPPDFQAGPMINRFVRRATDDFRGISQLASLCPEERRLTILLSGYTRAHSPPLTIYGLVSNFEDLETNQRHSAAQECFKFFRFWERRPAEDDASCIVWIPTGAPAWRFEPSLRALLRERKPLDAILAKAVDVVRSISEHPKMAGTVGQQVSAIWLPRDTLTPVTQNFDATIGPVHSSPDVIFALPRMACWIGDMMLGERTGPVVYEYDTPQRVRRNAPCHCNSGLPFKHCHGKIDPW